MRVTGEFINYEDIDVTLKITMSLRDWKELRKQLKESHPSFILELHIRSIIDKLDVVARSSDDVS